MPSKNTKMNMTERILSALEQHQDRCLVSDDVISWTGALLSEKMQSLHAAIKASSSPGGRVGICFPNWGVKALAILSVITAGRIPVVLSSTDLKSSPDDWLENAQVPLIMTMPGLEEILSERVSCVTLARDGTIEFLREASSLLGLKEYLHKPPAGTGLILFTSGSTGRPKGVCLPAEGLLQTADHLISYFGLSEHTISPIVLPICHSMAINTQFFPTFLAGGQSCFMNSRLSINRVYRTILEQKGTFISLIGEVLRTCWEEKHRKNLEAASLVEHIQLAGGMISEAQIQMARELFPRAVIHKGYGLTEAIRVTMINSAEKNFTSSAVGKPLPFVEVEIRNKTKNRCAPGESGEIFVRGPNVLLGITGDSESPVGTDGFLATGDVGFFNQDHQICILGRKDSLFKINGHRVSGFEIENIALEASKLITNAKCMTISRDYRPGQKLVLFLEVQTDSQEDFTKEYLPAIQNQISNRFKALNHFPREINLLPKFPRTSNGKLALKKLLEINQNVVKVQLQEGASSSLQFFMFPLAAYEKILA